MSNEEDPERVRFAIIGAGASGLQCASLLCERYDAKDVLVLEARDRIGGRIHSVPVKRRRVQWGDTENHATPDDAEVNFLLDHGAAWVHGTGYHEWGVDPKSSATPFPMENPVMKLLQKSTPPDQTVYEYHLNNICSGNPWMRPHSVAHEPNKIAIYLAGEKLENTDPLIFSALERHYATMHAVGRKGRDMFASGRGMEMVNISLNDTIVELESNSLPLSETERRIHVLSQFYQHLIGIWYGKSTAELPLWEFAHENERQEKKGRSSAGDNSPVLLDGEYTEEGDFLGPHCTTRRGMIAVLDPLLENGVKNRVLLNQQVTRVTLSGNNNESGEETVMVETQCGRKVIADCCVVTVSAGCLRRAVCDNRLFTPSLSEEKIDAVEHLSMGAYKKVFLTFDRIFWPTEPAFIGMVRSTELESTADDRPLGNFLLLDNLWARDGLPCIEAILSLEAGHWAAHKSTEVIRDAVLDFMDAAAPQTDSISEYCVSCDVTRWEEDEFSYGAYSSTRLGASIRHGEELRRPEWGGRLVFSGEATEQHFEGSVHAALISGTRASEKAMEVVGGA